MIILSVLSFPPTGVHVQQRGKLWRAGSHVQYSKVCACNFHTKMHIPVPCYRAATVVAKTEGTLWALVCPLITMYHLFDSVFMYTMYHYRIELSSRKSFVDLLAER